MDDKFCNMQEVADYYNNVDTLNTNELERLIDNSGWISDCGTTWGVCHNDEQKVIINDDGEAVVVKA